jgi:hypothetical protein
MQIEITAIARRGNAVFGNGVPDSLSECAC